MDKKNSLLAFMLGMAVGSAVTWQMIKDRYERRIEEDRKSLEEMYAAKLEEASAKVQPVEEEPEAETPPDPKEIAEHAREKPEIAEYARRLREEDIPYVISPDEFGEMDGYEKISLTYFADGVLADEDNEPVDDVAEIVGDGLEHFGEYEEDSVFVRNDAKKCDYEILRDLRAFSDVLEDLPPR